MCQGGLAERGRTARADRRRRAPAAVAGDRRAGRWARARERAGPPARALAPAAVPAPRTAGEGRAGYRPARTSRERQGDEVLRTERFRRTHHRRRDPQGAERRRPDRMTGAVIAISIVLIVFAAAAAITLSYYRLQRHRADAVALAGYRRLAEEAAAAQTDIRAQLTSFDQRLAAIEKLLKDIP